MLKPKHKFTENMLFKNDLFSFNSLYLLGRRFYFKLNDDLNYFNDRKIEFVLDDFIIVEANKTVVKHFNDFDEDLEVKLLEEDISKILNNLKNGLNNFDKFIYIEPSISFSFEKLLEKYKSKNESYIAVDYSFSIVFKLDIHQSTFFENFKSNLIKDIIQNYSYLFNNRYIDNQDLNVFVNAFYATECVDSFISKYFDKYCDSSLEVDIFNNEFKQYLSFNNDDEYFNLVELLKINYKH